MNFTLFQNYYHAMIKRVLFTIAIITILSCTEKKSVPDGIIPPEKMAQIISEIYSSEYKVKNFSIKADSSKILFRHYELRTFDQFETTDSIYKKSFEYYLNYPAKLEAIYDIVIDSLSLREQVLEKKIQMKKKR